MSLKPKIATIAKGQLPSYFSESYPQFINFVEKYYEHLESAGEPLSFVRNILENHDYDQADEYFKVLLGRGVLNNMPSSLNVDKALLIKNAREIYREKGTEHSYKFLMNALFAETAEIEWGKDKYVRLNDSTFKQDNVITVRYPKLSGKAYINQARVTSIKLTENDNGFDEAPTIQLIRNDPAEKDLPIFDFNLSGYITGATIKNAGYGYKTASVVVTGNQLPGGTVAVLSVQIAADTSIAGITLENPGSGYTEKPSLQIVGNGGDGAEIDISWTAVLHDISIVHGGSGFSRAPTLQLVGGTGTVVYPTYTLPARVAEIGCSINSLGVIDSVNINYSGQNYQYKPTLKIKWLPDTEAVVDVVFQGDKVIDVRVMDGGAGYSVPPTVIFTHVEPDLMGLQGNRIEQLTPSYATAIVEDVVSYEVNGEKLYVLYLRKDGLKGTFNIGSVVSSNYNNVQYSAIVEPLLTEVSIDYPGSMYNKGQYITLGNAGGLGGRGQIESVTRGQVDEVIVTKGGKNYRLGDEVATASNDTGSNFSGVVSAIDGIGAVVTPIMEIDSYIINDNGSGYQAGDVLFIYPGAGDINGIPNKSFAQAQVSAVTDSNTLLGFVIESSGSGYTNGASFAILPDATSNSPLRQIRQNKVSYVAAGALDSNPGNVSYTLNGANGIASFNWVLTNTDILDHTVKLVINGVNAAISVASVDGNGAITAITISNSGINYVNPTMIIGSTTATRTATIVLSTDSYGKINGYTIIDGGLGYTTTNIVTVTELYGNGAVITPRMDQGGVRSLNFLTRGETTNIDKNAAIPYTILGGSGSGLVLDLYYRPAKMRIDNEGQFYTSYSLQPSGGHGSGAIVQPVIKDGVIISLTVSSGGLHYAYCNVSINTANGRGFQGVVELDASGTVTKIDVINGGSGYQSGESIIFAGVPTVGNVVTDATGVVNVVRDGVISDLIITDPGSLYHPDCIIEFSPLVGVTRQALVDTVFSGGKLTDLRIVDGGAGYSQSTVATIAYNETSSDVDPVAIFRGVGDFNNYALQVTKTATGTYTNNSIVVSNSTGIVTDMAVEGTGIAYGTKVVSVVGTTVNLNTPLIKNINNVTLTFAPIVHVTYRGATSNVAQANTGYMQVFPTKNFCVVNSVFPVLDFVDIWPDVTAKPVEATYNLYSSPMGQIISSSVETGGSGYFSQDEREPLSMVITGNGTGAILQPVLKDGSFTDVVIIDGGQGYNGGAVVDIIPSYGRGFGASVKANVVSGQITSYTVVHGGSGYIRAGYSNGSPVTYTLTGPTVSITGSGVGASAHCVVDDSGVITAVVMDTPGSGYDKPVITTSGGRLGGTPATFDAIITNGVITGVYIASAGTGYYYGTSAYIIGNGVDGEVGIDVETGITDVIIVDGGSGYGTSPTTYTIVDYPPAGVAPGYGAILHPIISSPLDGGVITGIEIIEKGKGYYNPEITISGSGSGANIVGIARRPIVASYVKTAGHNYVDATVLIVGDGTGAKVNVKLSRNSINDIQIPYSGALYSESPKIDVVDNSNFGAVSKIKILDPGSGYQEVPSLTINPLDRVLSDPVATGAEAVAYSDSIGKIRSVRFDEFAIGENYIPTISFPISAIMAENASFMINERVYVKDYPYQTADYSDGPSATVHSVDYDRNIVVFTNCTDEYAFITESGDQIQLETGTVNSSEGAINIVHENSYAIPITSTLVGVYSGVEARILKMNRATGTGVFGSVGVTPTEITSSRSYLNDNRAFIHNNQRYQDFSYIINTGLSIDQYGKYIDKILHPAGYAMYGNIKLNTNLVSKMQFPLTQEGRLLQEVVVLWLTLAPVMGKPLVHDYWRMESNRLDAVQDLTVDAIDNMLQDGIDSYETFPSDIRIMQQDKTGTYSQLGNTITVTSASHGIPINSVVALTFTSGNAVSEMLQVVSSSTNTFTVNSHSSMSTTGSVTFNNIPVRYYGLESYYPWAPGVIYNINSGIFTGDDVYLGKKRHTSSTLNYPDDEVDSISGTVSGAGSYVVTGISNTSGLASGQAISVLSGTPTLPSYTTISSVDSSSQITLSNPFTGTGAVVLAYEKFEPYWVPYYKAVDIAYNFA